MYFFNQAINWQGLEIFLGETLPICVKSVLSLCGYDTIFSLQYIDQDSVNTMEKHINENEMQKIKQFSCCHSEYYAKKEIFKLLPGHVVILLSLPNHVKKYLESIESDNQHPRKHIENYSFILREMIETAEINMYRDKHHANYSDTIRFFATYVFLLCGRSCYEMLRLNLPFPSVKTIRKS